LVYDAVLRRYVIANDLSSTAVDSIRRNVEFNGLVFQEASARNGMTGTDSGKTPTARVFVNEGDARYAS
jgi:tRNA G26 N,N-dimethylase Trm1